MQAIKNLLCPIEVNAFPLSAEDRRRHYGDGLTIHFFDISKPSNFGEYENNVFSALAAENLDLATGHALPDAVFGGVQYGLTALFDPDTLMLTELYLTVAVLLADRWYQMKGEKLDYWRQIILNGDGGNNLSLRFDTIFETPLELTDKERMYITSICMD